MKLIITDSSPIISLAVIQRLDILESFCSNYYLPRVVFLELEYHLPKQVPNSGWFLHRLKPRVLDIDNPEIFADFAPNLGEGERACFMLARETGIENLLIDDREARQFAESQGWNCFGTLGLMVKAKKAGLIQELRPYFATFAASRRHYTADLLNHVLHLAQEQPL